MRTLREVYNRLSNPRDLHEIVNHKKVRDQTKYTYDELSDAAKAKARSEVLRSFKYGHEDALSTAKSTAKANIHTAVNDKYHIKRVRNAKSSFDDLTTDRQRLERTIRSNNLYFLEDGTYVTYSLDYSDREE